MTRRPVGLGHTRPVEETERQMHYISQLMVDVYSLRGEATVSRMRFWSSSFFSSAATISSKVILS